MWILITILAFAVLLAGLYGIYWLFSRTSPPKDNE
jgi:flagellar basal body-associated protein FliL